MSTSTKPNLHIKAYALGPIASLDAPLSKFSQNLVYARNGTGKSFLTRAFRYLEIHGQGHALSDAAINLVSEESQNGTGSFLLSQGSTTLGSLSLNLITSQTTADINGKYFTYSQMNL